jgi:hypothetical protein
MRRAAQRLPSLRPPFDARKMMANDRNNARHWKSGAEGPRDPNRTEELERIADNLEGAADYQIGPDAVRPDEANRTQTGNARRAERAAGADTDPETLQRAERAFEENLGE